MGWRDVACMRAITVKVTMTISETGRQLRRPRSKWANKIEMDLKETGYLWATFTFLKIKSVVDPFEGNNKHSYFRNRRRIYEQLICCQCIKKNVDPSSYTVAFVKVESLLHFPSLFSM
jgi:hypothetical protein